MYVTKRVWRLNGASFLNPNGRVRVKEPNPHGRNQTSKVRPVLGDKVFLPCSLQFVTLGPCNLQGLFWNHSFCAITDSLLVKLGFVYKTLPKAQRTRGLSSYHKFKHKSWSNFIFRIPLRINFKISTKHQPLHKTSKSWPNLASESWPRFNFITSSKHQQK